MSFQTPGNISFIEIIVRSVMGGGEGVGLGEGVEQYLQIINNPVETVPGLKPFLRYMVLKETNYSCQA